MHRRASVALVVATLTVLTAACTDDPETTTTTTGPRSSTTAQELTPDPRLAAEREAIQALKDYTDLENTVAKAGFKDYFQLIDLVTSDYGKTYGEQLYSFQQSGVRQVGDATLSDFKVIDHHTVESELYDDQLSVEVCIDNSKVDLLYPDGTSVMQTEAKGRWVTTVTLWHRTGTQWWYVAGYLMDGGRPC